MELHAKNRILPMAHAHNQTVICPCCDIKNIGKVFAADNQGMIACCLNGVRQIGEDIVSFVMNHGGFSVPDLRSAGNLPSIDATDALMSEANAKDGDAAAKTADDLD